MQSITVTTGKFQLKARHHSNEQKRVIYIKGKTVVQQLALLPHSKKVICSIQRTSSLLNACSLPVLVPQYQNMQKAN